MAWEPPPMQPGRRPMIEEPAVDVPLMLALSKCRPRPDLLAASIIIDRSSSKCNACGGDATPDDESHERLIGYHPSHEQGCGIVWTHVSSNYSGEDQERAVRDLKPNLIWQPFSWPAQTQT